METVPQLQQQHADLFTYVYCEGILNKQFIEVHTVLHPEPEDPKSLQELADLYYEASEKRLHNVAIELREQEVDYGKLREIVREFKEPSLCIGFPGLINTCDAFATCYRADNFEGCVRCLEHLKNEYYLLKRRLKTLFQLEDQILAAGGTVRIIEHPRQKMKKMFYPK